MYPPLDNRRSGLSPSRDVCAQ